MDAVLGVDLQVFSASVFPIFNKFIDPGGTEPLLGPVIEGEIDVDGRLRVPQAQMAGLFFFVVGAGQINRTQFVEGNLAVRFGVFDFFAIGGFFKTAIVVVVMEGPGLAAKKKIGVEG